MEKIKISTNNNNNIHEDINEINNNSSLSNYETESNFISRTHTNISTSSYISTSESSIFSSEEIVFTKISLFLFDNDNKFRKFCQKIIINRWVIMFINLIIIINSLVLVFETYTQFNLLSQILNYIFFIIYFVEFIFKIVAYGFVLNENTYLRDPWNWLDFFVVITSTITLLLSFSNNFNYLRLFRIIRLLKAIKIFPNLKRFVSTIVNSFYDLISVFLLLFFFYLFFSIFGLTLFNERFNYLCRLNKIPENGVLFINPVYNNTLCGGYNDCYGLKDYCVSSFKFYKEKKYFMNTYYYENEIESEHFNYGYLNFNNIFTSFLTVFIISTGHGWSKLMYLMMNGLNYYVGLLYFVCLIIINFFFMKNLNVAVLLYNFEKSRKKYDNLEQYIRRRRTKKFFKFSFQQKIFRYYLNNKYRQKYPLINRKKKLFVKNVKIKTIESNKCFKKYPPKNDYHKKFKLGYYCYILYMQFIFQLIFIIIPIVNLVILAYGVGEDKPKSIFLLLNFIFILIYLFDKIIMFLSFGLEIFKETLYILEILILIIIFIELLIKRINNYDNKLSIFSSLMSFHIFRIFQLSSIFEKYVIISESIKKTSKRMIDFLILFILFLYIYSLLGYSLFNNRLKFDDGNKYNESSNSTKFNFDNFFNSLLTTFIIIFGDNFESIFIDCLRSKKISTFSTIIYFITIVLICQITLLNIFLAYLIDNFEESYNCLYKNIKVKKLRQKTFLIINKILTLEERNLNILKKVKKKKVENIFSDYLFYLSERKLAKKGILVYIGMSKINFITNEADIIEDYMKLNTNKNNKFLKEIIFKKLFDEKIEKKKRSKNEINEIEFYDFNVAYDEKYQETQIIKKLKSADDIETNKNFVEILLNKNEIKKNSKFKRMRRKSKSNINKNIIYLHPTNSDNYDNNNNDNINIKIEKNKKNQTLHNNIINLNKFDDLYTLKEKNTKVIQQEKIDLIEESKWEKIKDYCKNSSCFIFHQNMEFRIFVRKLVSLKEFNYIILVLIILNVIIICLDNNFVRNNSSLKYFIEFLNYFLNIIFIIEGALKIIAYDFLFSSKDFSTINLKGTGVFQQILDEIEINDHQNFDQMNENEKMEIIRRLLKKVTNQKAYLRNPMNIIDFICIIISIVDMVGLNIYNMRLLRTIRSIRGIKSIRLFSKSETLQIMIKSLLRCIPEMINILFICIIYLLTFSIIGMELFKDDLDYYCTKKEYLNNENLCLKYKGFWVKNSENFNNFWSSLLTIFEIMMGENWTDIMYFSNQIKKRTIIHYLYFIFAFLLGNLFIFKLIITILIKKYKEVKESHYSMENLKSYEKDWVKLQKLIAKYKPVRSFNLNENPGKIKELSKFVNSKLFEKLTALLIFFSTLILLMQYKGMSKTYFYVLEGFNYLIIILFNLEIILKILCNGVIFYYNRWNSFDLIIVILCDILVCLNILEFFSLYDNESLSALPTLFRLFKILVILRLLTNTGKLKQLINTIFVMIPKTFYVSLIIGIVLLIYANIGMNIFGTVLLREEVTKISNFQSFFPSFLLLFRITTGENWNKLMHEFSYHNCNNSNDEEYQRDFYCVNYNKKCYSEFYINFQNLDNLQRNKFLRDYSNLPEDNINLYHFTCGSNFSYIFFISFEILCPFFLLNMCIVMIIDGFSDSMEEDNYIVSEEYIRNFINLWLNYDPNCNLLITPYEFVLIFKELQPPFGINYDRKIFFNPLKEEKFYNQYLFFNKYLNYYRFYSGNEINYNDAQFKNKNNFLYGFNFTNFYISHSKKKFTNDLEVIKILEKFDLNFIEEKNVAFKEKRSYLFSNKLVKDDYLKNFSNFYIHFVDVCLFLSRYGLSSFNKTINFDDFRVNLVNSYTLKMWVNYFNSNEIIDLFSKKIENDYENKMSYKMALFTLEKIKKIYKIKMDMLDDFKKNMMEKNKKLIEKNKIKRNFTYSFIKKNYKRGFSNAKFNNKLFNILKKMKMKGDIKKIIKEDKYENISKEDEKINDTK